MEQSMANLPHRYQIWQEKGIENIPNVVFFPKHKIISDTMRSVGIFLAALALVKAIPGRIIGILT